MIRSLLILLLSTSVASAVTEERFRVATGNVPQAEIAGALWRAEGGAPRGTVFMCHGFGRSMWDSRGYTWIAETEHFNVVRFDFREHGESSHSMRLPTLGYYEIYDLKAVIDWAEQHHLQRPYVCYGQSMGAAIALRWAGQDRRISAVMAQSPFRNAGEAVHQFRPNDVRVQLASDILVHGGLKRMLYQVDIPSAVRRRDDLMLWLTTSENDDFTSADQQAILAASPSPQRLKRFEVIPGYHGGQWKWAGNDALIRSFLNAAASAASPRGVSVTLIVDAVASVVGVAVVVVLVLRRAKRVLATGEHASPSPVQGG